MSHGNEPLASTDELLEHASRESEDVALYLATVRTAYSAPASAPAAERHIAAILEAVQAQTAPATLPQTRRRRGRAAVLIAAAVAATLGLLTGLSYAGVVTFPSSIRSAFDSVGIHLPAPEQPAPVSPGESVSSGSDDRPETATVSTPAPSGTSDSHPASVSAPARRGDHPGRRSGDVPDRKRGDSPENPGDDCDLPTLLCGI